MRARLFLLILVAAGCAVASPARAAVSTSLATASAANGIALGADGNLWVAEEFNGSVVRMTPGGTVIKRYAIGDQPTTVALGPGGFVWVAVTGSKRLVRFDANQADPAPVTIQLTTQCGPVALVSGGDGRMYFSLPAGTGCNGGLGTISSILATATTPPIANPSGDSGSAYDLVVSSGKLFVPSFDDGAIRRFSLGTAPVLEANYTIPGDGSPDGITADAAGRIWATDYGTGRVLRINQGQSSGAATVLTPTGGSLNSAFGIVASADGFIYVTGKESKNLLRVSSDGTQFKFFPLDASQPFTVIDGPSGDLLIADQGKAQLVRFVNGPPRPGSATASVQGDTSIAVNASVDPHGNETTVVIDYGLTTDYGQSSPAVTIPAGLDAVAVPSTLAGLQPGATYHLRVRASNAEGSATSSDVAATLPLPAPAPTPTPTPTISGATLSPKKFAVKKGKKGGSKLTVTLSAPGTVDATISLQSKGVKKSKSGTTTCVAPPKKKAKGQKSCTRLKKKGTLHFGALKAGPNTIALTGKVGGKKLAPGKYTLIATLGASSTSVTFTIKR